MMTLQELKEIVPVPEGGIKIPSAKRLRETGGIVAEKRLENDAWIAAYRNGYALYHAGGHSTVFPIHTCGDYLYISSGVRSFLPGRFFEKEAWYVRLALEGEDRLAHNQRVKEQDRTVSYHALSEEWQAMGDKVETPLEKLLHRENEEEMLRCLTQRQKLVVCRCIFQQKSRKETAAELGISSPAVSAILSQAARRLRKKYPSIHQAEKAVAAV